MARDPKKAAIFPNNVKLVEPKAHISRGMAIMNPRVAKIAKILVSS